MKSDSEIVTGAEQQPPSAVVCSALLGRIVLELIARRGTWEQKAYAARMTGADESGAVSEGCLCRAAGLAESIAIIQAFGEALSPNAESSNSREKTL